MYLPEHPIDRFTDGVMESLDRTPSAVPTIKKHQRYSDFEDICTAVSLLRDKRIEVCGTPNYEEPWRILFHASHHLVDTLLTTAEKL